MKKISLLMFLALFLVSCGPTNQNTSSPSSSSSPSSELKEFSNLTFNSKEVTYDGSVHSLMVNNVPSDASIIYQNNEHIDAGTYNVSATVSKSGYKTTTLEATLTILKAPIKGISFEDQTFEYDAKEHSVSITGSLPSGVSVSYTCLEDKNITNKVINPGTYTIVATLEGKNHQKTELRAKVTVTSKLDELFTTVYNDKVYFQNALDKDRLYSYDPLNGTKKVNNNKAQYFTAFKNELYYRSDSMFAPAIVSLQNEIITTDNAEYLIDDEQSIYYAVNSLFGESGIYRLSITSNSVVKSKIYDGKAYFLQISGNDLYFADGNNGKKLSKINKNSNSVQTASLVIDEKINNLVSDGTNLYFTINNLAGDYIAKYNLLTNKLIKLTSDAGKDLTIVNNDLYYTNVDLLSSNLIGKGVYKVSTTLNNDNNLPGKLVIKSEFKDYEISSLSYHDGNLYFYHSYTKHLFRMNINNGEISDLLKDFVAPEDQNIVAKKGAVYPYKDSIYYQNQYDGDNLYVYNTLTKTNIRVTSTPVDDLYIYQDYLYYRQVSYFVNKDLYRMDLKNGGKPTLISTDDCGELEIYNDKIYFINYSGSNNVCMMDLDGQNKKVIHDDEAYNLRVYNNRLYFVKNSGIYPNGYLYYLDLTDVSKEAIKLDKVRTSYYEISNDKIYFRYLTGIGYTTKQLAVTDLNGENVDVLLEDIDPNSFTIVNDTIYFNNDVTGSYSVNSYNLITKEHKIIKKDVYAYNLNYVNGKLYYQSYINGSGVLGDGHFYELTMDGNLVKVDKL